MVLFFFRGFLVCLGLRLLGRLPGLRFLELPADQVCLALPPAGLERLDVFLACQVPGKDRFICEALLAPAAEFAVGVDPLLLRHRQPLLVRLAPCNTYKT